MAFVLTSSTDTDFLTVLKLLHDNGVDVRDGKKAYAELKKYECNESFCSILAYIFGCIECPLSSFSLPVSWNYYRRLAGITLKNNIESGKLRLCETVLRDAGAQSLSILRSSADESIVKVGAQILVKITAATSFEWWRSNGLVDLSTLLLDELLSFDELRCLGALYALQFLIDDVPKQVGASSDTIIDKVSGIVLSTSNTAKLRRSAFRTCLSLFDVFEHLDWDVEILSPLQVSLTRASRVFMHTCTTLVETSCRGDSAFMSLVFRGCQLLVNYFDYLVPLSAEEQARLSQVWITHVVHIVRNPVSEHEMQELGYREMLTEAIHLFCAILGGYRPQSGASAGNDLVASLCGSMVEMIPLLSDALIRYSHLSEEEVESIVSSDDYRVRDDVGAIQGHTAPSHMGDSEVSDEVVALSLRCAALRFVALLCAVDQRATVSALMPSIKSMWSSPQWKTREAATVLIGTLGAYLSTPPPPHEKKNGPTEPPNDAAQAEVYHLVRILIHRALDASEGVCVKSIALWALSRIVCPTRVWDSALLSQVVELWNSQLQSTSRRVQLTSVSALCVWLRQAKDFAPDCVAAQHVELLLQSFYTCAPVYTTRNLSLLVDMMILLLPLLAHSEPNGNVLAATMEQLGGFVYAERTRRATLFEQSYTQTFVHQHVDHSIVDKDVFALDRALIALQRLIPTKSLGIDSLQLWNSVLKDMVARRVYNDDVELVSATLTLCVEYLEVVPTAALMDWVRQTNSALALHVCELLRATVSAGDEQPLQLHESQSSAQQLQQHHHIAIDAMDLLYRLVRAVGVDVVFPCIEVVDSLHVSLVSNYSDEDDLECKCVMARLMCALALSATLTEAAVRSVCAVSASLRADSYDNSRVSYAYLSAELTRPLQAHPVLLPHVQLDVICALLSDAAIDAESTEAAIRLFRALATDAGVRVLAANMTPVVTLLSECEESVQCFPHLAGEVGALGRFLHIHCPEQLQQRIQDLPLERRQYMDRCIRGCV